MKNEKNMFQVQFCATLLRSSERGNREAPEVPEGMEAGPALSLVLSLS